MRKWLGVIFITIVLVGLALVIAFNWSGTGFHGKTLWDWLNLLGVLAIPVVVGFGAVWYTTNQTKASEAAAKQQREAELKRAEQQHEHEIKVAEQQREAEQEMAEQRYTNERKIVEDNQHEAALQAYIDKMSELLLVKNLRESVEEEVRNIARVRTLTVLPRLDPIRKASVLQFLGEAGLILKDRRVIDLHGADLSHVDLSNFSLYDANLIDFPLRNADLSYANLSYANLSYANLSEADLSFANLRHANLRGAILVGNALDGEGVNLVDADLSEADLRVSYPADPIFNGLNSNSLEELEEKESAFDRTMVYAIEERNAIDECLRKAKSLNGATMPDGTIHP